MELDKILEITQSDEVKLSHEFKDLLNKKMNLGMTDYMIEHGSLSDSFDKISKASRYYQCYREQYILANAISLQEEQAMEAQADLIDAETDLLSAKGIAEKLRAESKIKKYKRVLASALVQGQDLVRQLKAFNKVRLKLMPEIEAKYPEGINQADEDMWVAVAEYKTMLRAMGIKQEVNNIPLSQSKKAEIGITTGNPDMAAWYVVENKDALLKIYNGDIMKMLQDKFGVIPEKPKELGNVKGILR